MKEGEWKPAEENAKCKGNENNGNEALGKQAEEDVRNIKEGARGRKEKGVEKGGVNWELWEVEAKIVQMKKVLRQVITHFNSKNVYSCLTT